MIAILINKIISLAMILAMGLLAVKCGAMRSEDSKGLSKLSLFLVMPCVILSSFQVDYTDEVKNGLLLAVFASVVIHILLLLLSGVLKRTLKMDPLERMSVIYPNAGNLVIPLVSAMLGKEWVIYTSAFSTVQRVLLWSHGKAALCGEKEFNLKKILLNVNMIAIFIGVIMFFTRIRFPALIADALDTVGSMIGPMAMLVVGMMIADQDLKQLFAYRRAWLVALLRLIVVPISVMALLKLSGIANLVPGGKQVLLVTFLAVTTPSATTLTQFAQVYDRDAKYACAINVLTTLLCIVTIPVMVTLYQM